MDIECLIIDTEMVPYAMTMDMPIGNARKVTGPIELNEFFGLLYQLELHIYLDLYCPLKTYS